jgi:hypothetical protein
MSDELKGFKLILASPTYGPVDPLCGREMRVAIMETAKRGVEWLGDASPDRHGFGHARNLVTQTFLESNANGIMWVDSDMRQKNLDMTQLLFDAKEMGAEFMSGVYHQRRPPHDPCFYRWVEEKQGFQAADLYQPNVVFPDAGCGFGFVYTSRSAIEKIAKSKDFDPMKGWFPDERETGGFGEDLSFCWLARQAGVQLYINSSVILGHTGDPRVIYPSDQVRSEVKPQAAGPRYDWGIRETLRF